jgi:hypothetical protein
VTIADTRDAATLAGGAGEQQQPPSLLHAAQALLGELPGLLSDRVKLLSLELRRAGIALAQLVGIAVAAAILLITAWLALWVGIAGALMTLGLDWGWALLVVIAINVGAAFAAVQYARRLLGLLTLPATVRRLTVQTHEPPPMAPLHEPHPTAATSVAP